MVELQKGGFFLTFSVSCSMVETGLASRKNEEKEPAYDKPNTNHRKAADGFPSETHRSVHNGHRPYDRGAGDHPDVPQYPPSEYRFFAVACIHIWETLRRQSRTLQLAAAGFFGVCVAFWVWLLYAVDGNGLPIILMILLYLACFLTACHEPAHCAGGAGLALGADGRYPVSAGKRLVQGVGLLRVDGAVELGVSVGDGQDPAPGRLA